MLRRLKSLPIIILGLAVSATLYAQGEVNMRVTKGPDSSTGPTCYHVEVRNASLDDLKLASMNYRLFYNTKNLQLLEDQVKSLLPSSAYFLKVVQNLHNIDASGTGPLPFENDLGFLNYSIIYQDGSSIGVVLKQGQPWMAVSEICFNVTNQSEPQTVVLGRDQVTAKYGKAFVELSVYDSRGDLIAGKIISYDDLNFNFTGSKPQ